MRLLIIEDNRSLAEMVASAVTRSGFTADVAASLEAGEASLAVVDYTAIILDLGLPDGDGLELIRRLRAQGRSAPILVITARGGLEDRVIGLQYGADDYLLKPFAHEELIARLHAILRRPQALLGTTLTCGNVQLEPQSATTRIGCVLQAMSVQETQILTLFMRSPGRVLTKHYLEDQLFGIESKGGANAVEVAVHRLRKRLETAHATAVVVTVRGLGYFMNAA